MSDEPREPLDPVTPSGKKRYLLIAACALVFLLILPGIVLAVASVMSGVELISSYDADSVPDYDIMKTQLHGGVKTLWIHVQEGATADDVTIIAKHLVRNEKKSLSRIRFYYIVGLDPETKAFKEVISDNIDYSLLWNRKRGFRLLFDRSDFSSGGGSRPASGPPSFRDITRGIR